MSNEQPAGPQLDALVAEKVFGWSEFVYKPGEGMLGLPPGQRPPRPGSMAHHKLVPRYSCDIGAAWALVEKYQITVSPHGEDDCSALADGATVGKPSAQFTGFAAAAPLAICRSALNAVDSWRPALF